MDLQLGIAPILKGEIVLNDFTSTFLPEIMLGFLTENRGFRGYRQRKKGQCDTQNPVNGGDVNGWGYACTHDGLYYVG